MSVDLNQFIATPRGDINQPLLSTLEGGEIPSQVVEIKSKNTRYAGGTTALVAGGTVTFFRYYQGWTNPVAITFSAVGLGASVQTAADTILPRHMVQKIHHFQQHYITPELLALWQVYLNFSDIPWVNELALGTMCALGGSLFVIQISSVAFKRMADLQSTRKTYDKTEQLSVALEPQSRRSKTCWQIFKATLGSGAMLGSIWAKGWQATLINLGAAALGHAVGNIAHRFFDAQRTKIEDGFKQLQTTNPSLPIPRSLKVMRIGAKVAYFVSKTGWGMLIVPNHPAAYGTIGFIIGALKEAELKEFVRMTKINPEKELSPTMKKVSLVGNGTLLAGTISYVAYAMATPENTPIDQIVLGAFLAGGLVGYKTTRYLNRNFDPRANHTPMNTLQFYTDEHDDLFTFFYLYLSTQMELGDTALASNNRFGDFMATLAYGELGFLIGNGQAAPYDRGRFQQLANAFMGKLLVGRANGEY